MASAKPKSKSKPKPAPAPAPPKAPRIRLDRASLERAIARACRPDTHIELDLTAAESAKAPGKVRVRLALPGVCAQRLSAWRTGAGVAELLGQIHPDIAAAPTAPTPEEATD